MKYTAHILRALAHFILFVGYATCLGAHFGLNLSGQISPPQGESTPSSLTEAWSPYGETSPLNLLGSYSWSSVWVSPVVRDTRKAKEFGVLLFLPTFVAEQTLARFANCFYDFTRQMKKCRNSRTSDFFSSWLSGMYPFREKHLVGSQSV